MPKESKNKSEYKFDVKVKSKVFPDLHHTVKVDLYCYEKLAKKPSENKTKGDSQNTSKK